MAETKAEIERMLVTTLVAPWRKTLVLPGWRKMTSDNPNTGGYVSFRAVDKVARVDWLGLDVLYSDGKLIPFFDFTCDNEALCAELVGYLRDASIQHEIIRSWDIQGNLRRIRIHHETLKTIDIDSLLKVLTSFDRAIKDIQVVLKDYLADMVWLGQKWNCDIEQILWRFQETGIAPLGLEDFNRALAFACKDDQLRLMGNYLVKQAEKGFNTLGQAYIVFSSIQHPHPDYQQAQKAIKSLLPAMVKFIDAQQAKLKQQADEFASLQAQPSASSLTPFKAETFAVPLDFNVKDNHSLIMGNYFVKQAERGLNTLGQAYGVFSSIQDHHQCYPQAQEVLKSLPTVMIKFIDAQEARLKQQANEIAALRARPSASLSPLLPSGGPPSLAIAAVIASSAGIVQVEQAANSSDSAPASLSSSPAKSGRP